MPVDTAEDKQQLHLGDGQQALHKEGHSSTEKVLNQVWFWMFAFLRYIEDLTKNFNTTAEMINFADSTHASKVKSYQYHASHNSKGDQQLGEGKN